MDAQECSQSFFISINFLDFILESACCACAMQIRPQSILRGHWWAHLQATDFGISGAELTPGLQDVSGTTCSPLTSLLDCWSKPRPVRCKNGTDGRVDTQTCLHTSKLVFVS